MNVTFTNIQHHWAIPAGDASPILEHTQTIHVYCTGELSGTPYLTASTSGTMESVGWIKVASFDVNVDITAAIVGQYKLRELEVKLEKAKKNFEEASAEMQRVNRDIRNVDL
jgi:hypothetical protein